MEDYKTDDFKHALLVQNRRNWFPAYLKDFEPVESAEERAAGKVDQWVVVPHPLLGAEEQRKKAKDVMYLSDPRVATCAVSRATRRC